MEETNSQPLRVLVVEDDRVTARELAVILRRRGFIVAGTAHSAEEALALAESGRPRLGLVDVRLGETDAGIQLAARLREEYGMLVVFTTGYSEDSLYERAREARPVGFVRKPFSEGELVATLEAAAQKAAAFAGLSLRLPGLEAVADQVSQGIFATDLDGTLHYLNRAASALTGWSVDEAIGRPITEVAPLEVAGANDPAAAAAAAESSPGGEAAADTAAGAEAGEMPPRPDEEKEKEKEEASGEIREDPDPSDPVIDDGEEADEADAAESEADEASGTRAGSGSAPERSGVTLSREMVLTTRAGASVVVEERSAPIRSSEGDVVGLVTILAKRNSSAEAAPALIAGAASEGPGVEDRDEAEDDREMAPEGALPLTLEEGLSPRGERLPPSPARNAALRQLADLANNPGFRKLLPKRAADPSDPQGSAAFEGASAASATPARVATAAPEEAPAAGTVLAAVGSELIDDVGEPLLRIDRAGRITCANAEAISVFGGGRSLSHLVFWDRFSSESFERYDAEFQRPLVDGCRHRFDFHDSKRGLWFDVRVYPTEGGVLALFNDITAQKVASAENLRQQRLEGLGLLARGFAHDFNNQLTTIQGNISLAAERQPDDADLQQMLAEARTAATRASGLVQQLMTFAQGGRPIRRRTRILDLIRRILTEQRMQHPEIRYQFQGGEGDLVANIDPAQIGRLVENLVSNSATAMQEGGILIVRCERIAPERVLGIKATHNPAEEDHFVIEVIDTGHGMTESALSQVFEPYFTTRKEDNASGIGLTVCESIARAHGGFIQLQSKEGKGTIATFCAPLGRVPGIGSSEAFEPPDPEFALRLRAAAGAKDSAPTGENLLVGTRILILEDDAPIRRLMAATLRRAGHEVVETKDGRETVAVYEEALKRGAPFHLLISDLTIENGMGGVETMRRLTQIDPGILAIVSSGYSDAPAMSSPASFGFRGVLPKPYAPSELRAAVHRILSTHGVIS